VKLPDVDAEWLPQQALRIADADTCRMLGKGSVEQGIGFLMWLLR
jgi:hypothetical protein